MSGRRIPRPAIEAVLEEGCTSCFGCFNGCPFGAVSMELTKQGFYRPRIDRGLCRSCGLCRKHCPVLVRDRRICRTPEEVRAYAGWTKDPDLRKESSSGGIFTEAARTVLAQGGMVVGARWLDHWIVAHATAQNETELLPMRGSKYLQSFVGFAYRNIVDYLAREQGSVLFVGVPCQIAALATFVREHPRLFTIDLACHGTPSQAVFKKYLKNLAKDNEITSIRFRDKEVGWSKFNMLIRFADREDYRCIFREDPFMIGFLSNLYLNKACYRCTFCSTPRQGDLTLADYWGVPREIKSSLGVSLVLSNNNKGDQLLQSLLDSGNVELQATPFEATLRGNPRLVDGYLEIPDQYEEFFQKLPEMAFFQIQQYIEQINCFSKK